MNGVVQISCLGTHGRFGNQLFQYAIARAYAERIGARLQTPAWIGEEIFAGVHASPMEGRLPRYHHDQIPDGRTDIDLYGYFQFHDAVQLLSRAKLKEWFRLKPEVEEKWKPQVKCGSYCAWHLRLEDYVSDAHFHKTYASVRTTSYLRAMHTNGIDLPLITVSADFTRGWLTDFMLCRDADVLFRANSTFSWWAGVLGTGRVFSPVIDDRVGWQDVEFIEGNWPRFVNLPNVTDLYLPD